jgi:hypothetical protein
MKRSAVVLNLRTQPLSFENVFKAVHEYAFKIDNDTLYQLAFKLNHVAETLEKRMRDVAQTLLEEAQKMKRDGLKSHPNSLGVLQSHGIEIDLMCAQYDVIRDVFVIALQQEVEEAPSRYPDGIPDDVKQLYEHVKAIDEEFRNRFGKES